MKNSELFRESERIKQKIREFGRDSLTYREKQIIAYSPYGDAAGCPSVVVESGAAVPDYYPTSSENRLDEQLMEEFPEVADED